MLKLAAAIASITTVCGQPMMPSGMLDGLNSEDFSVREASENALLVWGLSRSHEAGKTLVSLYDKTIEPETRKRIQNVLRAMADKDYFSSGKGYLGIQMQEEVFQQENPSDKQFVIRISFVMPDSPASKQDLRVGDLMIKLDDIPWHKEGAVDHFRESIASRMPQEIVKIRLKRGDELLLKEITLGKMPVDDLQKAGLFQLNALENKAKRRHFSNWLEERR